MTVHITEFTDPGCPWAYAAEPRRWRLLWLYGDALRFERRMVGLSSSPEDYARRDFTPQREAEVLRRIQRRSGMPMDPRERPRMTATIVACRAVVAARVHGELGDDVRILRRLRIAAMSGAQIDEAATVERAAREAGLVPTRLHEWMTDERTEAALREDMELARRPLPAALHLEGKLASCGDDAEGKRYTCPSYVFRLANGDREIAAPGFQPIEVYEVIVANLAPEIQRRPNPASVEEVLAWAGEPLATAEVAAICELEPDDAHAALARVAETQPVGTDAFWSLPASAPALRAA